MASVVEFQAITDNLNGFNPRHAKVPRLILSREECLGLTKLAQSGGLTDCDFTRSGELRRPFVRRFVQLLRPGVDFLSEEKQKTLLELCDGELRFQRTFDYEKPLESKTPVAPPSKPLPGSWNETADNSICRLPDFEDRTRKTSTTSKPSPAATPRQVIDRSDCIHRPNSHINQQK